MGAWAAPRPDMHMDRQLSLLPAAVCSAAASATYAYRAYTTTDGPPRGGAPGPPAGGPQQRAPGGSCGMVDVTAMLLRLILGSAVQVRALQIRPGVPPGWGGGALARPFTWLQQQRRPTGSSRLPFARGAEKLLGLARVPGDERGLGGVRRRAGGDRCTRFH